MEFLKEHLVHNYHWPEAATKQFSGLPSRRSFDPDNGPQVLFIINCFYDSIGLNAVDVGRRLEDLIYRQLPLQKMSELSVFNWVKGVYLYHSDL